jgi:hypothetical protein
MNYKKPKNITDHLARFRHRGWASDYLTFRIIVYTKGQTQNATPISAMTQSPRSMPWRA